MNSNPSQQFGNFQSSIKNKLRESAGGAEKVNRVKIGLNSHEKKTQTLVNVEPLRYFSSLEEENEIDPDIVADMARYL